MRPPLRPHAGEDEHRPLAARIGGADDGTLRLPVLGEGRSVSAQLARRSARRRRGAGRGGRGGGPPSSRGRASAAPRQRPRAARRRPWPGPRGRPCCAPRSAGGRDRAGAHLQPLRASRSRRRFLRGSRARWCRRSRRIDGGNGRTVARRASARARAARRSPSCANGMAGFGVSRLAIGGIARACRHKAALIRPATPAAASRWPMLALTEPTTHGPLRRTAAADHRAEGARLERVADGGAGAVRLDVADARGIDLAPRRRPCGSAPPAPPGWAR